MAKTKTKEVDFLSTEKTTETPKRKYTKKAKTDNETLVSLTIGKWTTTVPANRARQLINDLSAF